jgi:hypothetical protein
MLVREHDAQLRASWQVQNIKLRLPPAYELRSASNRFISRLFRLAAFFLWMTPFAAA